MLELKGELAGIFGIKVFTDINIPEVLLYPTGRKDGNRLGRRKRNLMTYQMYVTNKADVVFHPSTLETKAFKKQFGEIR